MSGDDKNFADRILPALKGKGFCMADYWVWGSSVIQDPAGQYHMFASRWPKHLPMFAGYKFTSEIVRAVSTTPEGPYRFVERVLPFDDGMRWTSCPNPKAYSRHIRWDDESETTQGCIERPKLLFDENGRPTHLFAATGDGPGDFRNATKTWNMVVPLVRNNSYLQ